MIIFFHSILLRIFVQWNAASMAAEQSHNTFVWFIFWVFLVALGKGSGTSACFRYVDASFWSHLDWVVTGFVDAICVSLSCAGGSVGGGVCEGGSACSIVGSFVFLLDGTANGSP